MSYLPICLKERVEGINALEVVLAMGDWNIYSCDRVLARHPKRGLVEQWQDALWLVVARLMPPVKVYISLLALDLLVLVVGFEEVDLDVPSIPLILKPFRTGEDRGSASHGIQKLELAGLDDGGPRPGWPVSFFD